VRVLLFALAPVLELEHALGGTPSEIAAASEQKGPTVPLHNSATCPACLLLHTQVWAPDGNVISLRTVETEDRIAPFVARAVDHASRDTTRSRAPPADFV